MPRSKSEQRLECCHRRFPPIVTKYEFIQINLELFATHTVMSPQQPLLEITDGPVRQRHCGLRSFPQVRGPRLTARHVLKACLFQPSKALQSVGVYSGTWLHAVLKEAQQSLFSEVRDHRHACAPGGSSAPLLDGHQHQPCLASLELATAPQAGLGYRQPMYHQLPRHLGVVRVSG